MDMETRIMFAVAGLVAASPGTEEQALERLIAEEPNEHTATRIKNMGVSLEQIRHYARIALDEWRKP